MRKRFKALFVVGAVAATLATAAALFVVVDFLTSPGFTFTAEPFNAEAWRASTPDFSHESPRLQMVDDFLANHSPVGMTRDEIVALLGEPTQTDKFAGHGAVYFLGPERGWISIDGEWLLIDLDDDGTVVNARIVRD